MAVSKIIEIASSLNGAETTARVSVGANSPQIMETFINNVRSQRLDPRTMTIAQQQAIISEEMAKIGCFKTED